MRIVGWKLASLLSCVLVIAACAAENGRGAGSGAGGGGGDGTGGDGEGGLDAGTSQTDAGRPPPRAPVDAGPDAGCGATSYDIELINLGDPPDMLIVLDRSGSMCMGPGVFPSPGASISCAFGSGGSDSKWGIMRDVLSDVTERYRRNIRFGLSLFPTDDSCGVEPGMEVPMAFETYDEIAASMRARSPNGFTPAYLGLREARSSYGTVPVNDAGRFVLFATDGMPNCGGEPPTEDSPSGAETVAAVEGLRADGIDTFVLGFALPIGFDTGVLNDAAVAGGHPRSGSTKFYEADDAASLEAALLEIAGGVIVPSCSYELGEAPPDPELVTVKLDGEEVPRDLRHGRGWDYHPDENTITFFGPDCDRIESGAITDVDFIYGCPGEILY